MFLHLFFQIIDLIILDIHIYFPGQLVDFEAFPIRYLRLQLLVLLLKQSLELFFVLLILFNATGEF